MIHLDDPKQYIIDFLKRLQDAKSVKMDYPNIFDESNVASLFGILDPSSKGTITHTQYKSGISYSDNKVDVFLIKGKFYWIYKVN